MSTTHVAPSHIEFQSTETTSKETNISDRVTFSDRVLIRLLAAKEYPEEFAIEYNPDFCCDATDLPEDSF